MRPCAGNMFRLYRNRYPELKEVEHPLECLNRRMVRESSMIRITGKNLLTSVLLLLVLGAVVLWWVGQSTDRTMRAELLQQARIAAKALPADHLKALTGTEKDLDSVAYQSIKSQLKSIRQARPRCRFLYLMGRRADGTVYFFVDSLPLSSKDYAPPGLVYAEVPDAYLLAFKARNEAVVGPVTDRWGTLVTALIPIVSSDDRGLLAVLGMDVDAQDWKQEIIGRCIGPSLVILLLIVLLFLLASRERILGALRNSEEMHRNIVENATNMFFSHTADHELTYISPQCREFLQCEPEEAKDRWTKFATDNPINEKGLKWNKKAIDTGAPQKPYELELIGIKGKTILVEVNEKPVLRDEKTVGIVGSLTDITQRKKAEDDLRRERDKLIKALAEIKTLKGIIPICSVCKQIRDDQGYWNQIEKYISEHSDADFTHGICPDCAKKYYADLDLYGAD